MTGDDELRILASIVLGNDPAYEIHDWKAAAVRLAKAIELTNPVPSDEWEDKYLKDTLDRLARVTKGCRKSMHEPDEQDVDAKVAGWVLDNAGSSAEICIFISQGDRTEVINLATLIALARLAKV